MTEINLPATEKPPQPILLLAGTQAPPPLAEVLRTQGLDLLPCHSAAAALRYAEVAAIAVLDLALPVVTPALVQQLAERYRLPIIGLAGGLDPRRALAATRLPGMTLVLRQNDPEQLHLALRSLLQKPLAPFPPNNLFHSLLETTHEAVCITCGDQIVYANRAAAEMAGLVRGEELLGRPLADFVDPAYRDRMHERIQAVLHHGQPGRRNRYRSLRVDGTGAEVEVQTVPFLYEGRPSVLIAGRDITAQVRAEEHLRRLAGLRNLLLDISSRFIHLPVGELDPAITEALAEVGRFVGADGSFIYQVNLEQRNIVRSHFWARPGNDSLVGVTPQIDLAQLPWLSQMIHRRQVVLVDSRNPLPATATAEAALMEEWGVRAAICSPLLLGENLVGYVGYRWMAPEVEIPREVVEELRILSTLIGHALSRRSAQQALFDSKTVLRTIIDALPHFIFARDAEGRYTFANLAVARAYGIDDVRQLVGRLHSDVDPLATTSALSLRDDQEVLQHGTPRELPRELFVDSAGHERVLQFAKYPLPLPGGQQAVLGVGLDVTEQEHARREREYMLQELERSEKLLRTLVDATPDRITIKDTSGCYLFVNKGFAEGVGLDPEQCIGATDADLGLATTEELSVNGLHPMEEVVLTQGELPDQPWIRQLQRGEQELYFDTILVPLRDDRGEIYALLGYSRDVTALREAEDRLRQSATVFAATSQGVTITDPAGRIIDVNRAFTEITGYRRNEVLGRRASILKSGRHDAEFYQQMWQALTSDGQWSGEIWNRDKRGRIYPEWLNISAVTDASGQVTHYVGVFSDISSIKESQAQLQYLAHHDPLTELPNRLLLGAQLDHAILRSRRKGGTCGLLLLDLDNFKQVNDTFGHSAGDELLQLVAARLQLGLNVHDTVARLGSDEFAVLLEDLPDSETAGKTARRIQSLFENPFLIGGTSLYVTLSIGLSLYPSDGEDGATLMKNAESAMHRAKSRGRNSYEFYTSEFTRRSTERLMLESHLRRAMGKGEFELYYQPQVELASGQLIGFESLIRWNSPEMGLVMPDRFIPLAEETGLVTEIGLWSLEQVGLQLQAWQQAGLEMLPIAVNLSARQFQQEGLVEQVVELLERLELPPQLLELEVTESALMSDIGRTTELMRQLCDRGIALAIDDFGTGYSSLAYLHRFPIRRLKIDRSFVRDLHQRGEAAAIAASILRLADTLGVDVVAEGVERAEQEAFLVQEGCRIAQGFLYHPPLTAAKATELLGRQRPQEKDAATGGSSG